MWLRDFHIDGLRIDAVHAFVDRSAIHFLEQLAVEVEALEAVSRAGSCSIAESDLNDPRVVTPREAGGFGIDAQWSDDFHHALFTVLCPGERQGYYADFGSLAQLAKAIIKTFVYDGIYSRYRNRIHGRPPGRCRSIDFSATFRITIRWAIARWATGSATLPDWTRAKIAARHGLADALLSH